MIFPRYAHERNNVLNDTHQSFPSAADLQLRDKFIWLMSQENKYVTLRIAYFLKRANEIRINELESRIFFIDEKRKKEIKKNLKLFVSRSIYYVYQNISVTFLRND